MFAGLLIVVAFVWLGTSRAAGVFVEQPVPVAAAPFGSQVRLRCSVIEGNRIYWGITLPSDPDLELSTEDPRHVAVLRNINGIEAITLSDTNSTLAIDGTEVNSEIKVTCIAFVIGSVNATSRSGLSQVSFYGPPSVPFNLSVMENGNGSLNISWSHTTTEGEEKFILNATNLNNSNADPILVTGIEDFYKILSIQDSMPCDVYSFQVTATNDAGASGPSDSITSTFPALPNISTVVEHYSLRNMDDGVTLNVTLTGAGVISCPERNYTLVVVDSEGTRATQTSQATGDVVNIVVRDLRENTRYRYHVVATNRFGNSDPSTTVEFLADNETTLSTDNSTVFVTDIPNNGSTDNSTVFVTDIPNNGSTDNSTVFVTDILMRPSNNGLSTGDIVGIAIGLLIVLIVLFFLVLLVILYKTGRLKRIWQRVFRKEVAVKDDVLNDGAVRAHDDTIQDT